jgi:hypothetical protein
VLFAQLVAGALERTRVRPTPLASAYLVGLLEARLRPAPEALGADGSAETLAEGLLKARLERGELRIRRLRGLGDRALFVAGFFGDSLGGRGVGIRYYRDAGSRAYGDLAAALAWRASAQAGSHLFEELADRFSDFVEVLTHVGDESRAQGPRGLLPLYDRYLRGGSERDRRRLIRLGQTVPGPLASRRPQ